MLLIPVNHLFYELTLLFMPNSLYGFLLNSSCYPSFGFFFWVRLIQGYFDSQLVGDVLESFGFIMEVADVDQIFGFFSIIISCFLLTFFVSFVVIVGLFICQIFFALMDNYLCISMHIDLIFIFLLSSVLIFLFLEKN